MKHRACSLPSGVWPRLSASLSPSSSLNSSSSLHAFRGFLIFALLLATGCLGRGAFAQSATAQGTSASGTATQGVAALSAEEQAISARIAADVQKLSAFPSRVVGTPGNLAAAKYVEQQFSVIGLDDVKADEYQVTAPVTEGGRGTLTVGGRTMPVYPLYPNGVAPSTTPKDGLKGRVIYAGAGNPADFRGLVVEDAIVALDFNSGMNWITAADLGARAIVFLEREASGGRAASNRSEAERKFAAIPVEMPRFYLPKAEADALLASPDVASTGNAAQRQNTLEATLICRSKWERVPARNIVGTIEGTDDTLKKQTIVIGGYYDSMSVVPDLAPGAEAAVNMATLLEMARYFKANPPKYSLMFMANGAHHITLAGMRNFAAKHFVDLTGSASDADKERMKSYRAFVGLDITSRTPTVGLFAKSSFYNQMSVGSENILMKLFFPFAKTMYEDYAKPLAKGPGATTENLFVDGIRGLAGRTWRSYLPSLVALDSEVAMMAQKPGISFATANDVRLLQDTPSDTAQYVNTGNVARQISTLRVLMSRGLDSGKGDKKNDFETLPDSSSLSLNFGYAAGRAIYRDVSKITSFLPSDPVPSAIGYILNRATEYKSYSGVRGAFVEKAQETSPYKKGSLRSAQFLFLGPRVGDPKGGGMPESEIEAYSVDDEGRITFAPDQGAAKGNFSPRFNKAGNLAYKDKKSGELEVNATTMCFPCRAVALYDTLDQRYFQILREMTVLDGQTDANPVEYGYIAPLPIPGMGSLEPVGIIFGKAGKRGKPAAGGKPETPDEPGARLKLIMAQGLIGKRLLLLGTDFNGKIDPEGVGVQIPFADEPAGASVHNLSYRVALDMWTLDQQRINLLQGFGISNERVAGLHGAVGCAVAKTPKAGVTGPQYDCPAEGTAAPSGGALMAAKLALDGKDYATFYRESRRAFGIESRAYPDVEATAQDVLKGIVFYLALLLPFAFFLERLLFGYPDVRKQLTAVFVMFLAVFFGISRVHPAFELALTPFIILLAFIILALTVVVTSFLSSKFEAEIKRMKQGVHFADVGRLSAISAALGLGIANMRRRPTRTALTCVTLVLLTFTVLSFTSVTASISNFARPYGEHAPSYAGMMIRQPDWSPMQEAAVSSMRNEFTQKFGPIALRAWYLSRDQGEPLQLRVANANDPTKYFHAPALLGMTPEEKTIDSPVVKTLLSGRWFEAGDRNVCLLPRTMLVGQAKTSTQDGEKKDTEADLGLTPENAVGSKIIVLGQTLDVIGVYDDTKWTNQAAQEAKGNTTATTARAGLRDLDDEQFTPVDYQSESAKASKTATDQASAKGEEAQVQQYQHMDANALLVVPYETAIAMGGTTRSIAAGFNASTRTAATDAEIALSSAAGGTTAQAGIKGLEDLMQRAALGIFGASPNSDPKDNVTDGKLETRLYSSVESTSYEGFAALVVPIMIAALIIANTMLGSVYERTKEIGIYSSIGLAPVHVAALFIAEAIVYAVLGSISGYLIAQTVAKVVTAYNLLPGITLNYSSSSAIISTLIVMATVLLSTLYPAFQASRMSQPDIERRWQMSEPIGDVWRFQFPFTVSGLQPLGVAEFLADFFETHTDTSIGSFYTDRVHFRATSLRDAVAILNDVPGMADSPEINNAAPLPDPKVNTNGAGKKRGNVNDDIPEVIVVRAQAQQTGPIALENIAADERTEVYQLAMRVWLAPFDMGVSQDVDIFLLPSTEPNLYELQLKLVRQSGEIAAWKRVNRGFMSDLRKQLLLWRTIKPAGQQEYILRGRAHVRGEQIPTETPGAAVGSGVTA